MLLRRGDLDCAEAVGPSGPALVGDRLPPPLEQVDDDVRCLTARHERGSRDGQRNQGRGTTSRAASSAARDLRTPIGTPKSEGSRLKKRLRFVQSLQELSGWDEDNNRWAVCEPLFADQFPITRRQFVLIVGFMGVFWWGSGRRACRSMPENPAKYAISCRSGWGSATPDDTHPHHPAAPRHADSRTPPGRTTATGRAQPDHVNCRRTRAPSPRAPGASPADSPPPSAHPGSPRHSPCGSPTRSQSPTDPATPPG